MKDQNLKVYIQQLASIIRDELQTETDDKETREFIHGKGAEADRAEGESRQEQFREEGME